MKLDRIIAVRTNKTVYKDGDKVIKLFSEDYSKSDVFNEALNQTRVEETALFVPKILEVTSIDGKWAIIMENIEGKTLSELMAAHPEKEDEYLDNFVQLQIQVQKMNAPLLNKLRDKMDRKISETKLDASTKYELNVRLNGMPKHTKLCHGDFNPKNIIVNDKDEYFIIDWSHATQGNASADVARTYLLFKLEGHDALAEKYLKSFCIQNNTAIQYVQKWFPIVAASQLVKGNAKEAEFLKRWVNVVEFE